MPRERPAGDVALAKYGSATIRFPGDGLTLGMLDAFSVSCAASNVPIGAAIEITQGTGAMTLTARWTIEGGEDGG